ncbi:MAG: EamA family transporter [Verrucomicrobia bacterium]|nr:EamA family transporter [Verrucomicrobiota bacterium]
MSATPATSRSAIVLAFAAIYLIWGSTYLAIRVAVETLPPFVMAGARFVVAGTIAYAFLAYRGRARVSSRQIWDNAIVGGLLLVGGNGLVVWAEQAIPSGITTLIISVSPLFMVLTDWMLPSGARPTWPTLLGLALGFGGLVLLIGGGVSPGVSLDLWRCAGLMIACLSWSFGSLYSRYAKNPAEPMTAATLQMLLGGAMMLVIGFLRGETAGFHAGLLTLRSVGAWAYLVCAGSLIAFPAYVYLLKHSTPARVSTYAYVNPVVAVVLGWLVLGEPVTSRTLLASAIIIAAVAIITVQRSRNAAKQTA